MAEIEIISRWEASDTHEVDDSVAEELADRINAGDLDAVIEAGDCDSAGAELVDYRAVVRGV